MDGGPLSAQWPANDGRASVRWAGPAVVEAVTDTSTFDAEAARHLGLFAYNVARKFFPWRADLVEEAVQETLARTCERWDRASRRGCPEAWVVNTATNVCREKLREEARGARTASARPMPADGAEDLVRSQLLADALRRLTARQRVVIVWRYLFDFSVHETAGALGLTESKVRDASHNGVGRLRKLLGEEWDDLT
jgi:RNA polymerase sigma factor (sigma-70 family)